VVNEDNILMYRAEDFGGVLFLNEPLMLYRIHSESVSHKYLLNDSIKHFQKRIVQNAMSRISITNQIFKDSSKIKVSDSLMLRLEKQRTESEIELYFFGNGKFKSEFIINLRFYSVLFKWIFLKPYLYFK
jgi:hypothetical protein